MLRLKSASPCFSAQTLVKFPKEVMVLCCCQGTVSSQLPWDQAGPADQRGQSPALSVQTLKTCAFLCASSHCGERDHHRSLMLPQEENVGTGNKTRSEDLKPVICCPHLWSALVFSMSRRRLMDQTVSLSYLLEVHGEHGVTYLTTMLRY